MILRGWRRWLFGGCAALALGWTVIGSLANYFARTQLEGARARLLGEFVPHETAFKGDLEALAGNPLFAPRDGGDASRLLFAHLRWAKYDAWKPTLTGPPPLPLPLMSDLSRWGAEWTTHLDDPQLDGLDLAWLTELRSLGFWDLEPEGGPRDAVPYGVPSGVRPYLEDLYPLAKARLLQGLRRGDHRAAADEVRELAKLLLTTETIMGVSMAFTLLRAEEAAWERATLRGLEVSGWTPVRDAERKQLLRAAYASVATRSLMATGAIARIDVGVFQCAALNDTLAMAHFLSRYLGTPLRGRYAELDEELSGSKCRLRRARLNRQHPDESGQFPVSVKALCPGGPWVFEPPCDFPEVSLAWLPLVRLPLGSWMLLGLPRFDHFAPYRALAGSGR